MNQTISLLAAFLFASVLTVGCVDYDDATRAVSVDVQLVAPEEFTAANAGLEGRTVVITKQDGTRLAATTDASGQAHFAASYPMSMPSPRRGISPRENMPDSRVTTW